MPRFPFITPGTSKTTIYNGLVTKKIIEQLPALNQSLGGITQDDVTSVHGGEVAVSSAGTDEGTISNTPKNKVKLLDTLTKDTIEYDPGTGLREVFGRLEQTSASFSDDFDVGEIVGTQPTNWLGGLIDNTEYYSSPNSARVPPLPAPSWMIKTGLSVLYGIWEAYIKIPVGGTIPAADADWVLRDGGNISRCRIHIRETDGLIYYRSNGTAYSTGIYATPGQWAGFRFQVVSTSTYSAWANVGSGWLPLCINVPFAAVGVIASIARVDFDASGMSIPFYVDNVSWGSQWLLKYFYMSDLGVETAYTGGFTNNIDYWYPVRTNLRDVDEAFAVRDVAELPIDADKYAFDAIVDRTGGTGTHTTVTAALAYLGGAGSIWIKQGDYATEGLIVVNGNINIFIGAAALNLSFVINATNLVSIQGGGQITSLRITNGALRLSEVNITALDLSTGGNYYIENSSLGVVVQTGNINDLRIKNSNIGSITLANGYNLYGCQFTGNTVITSCIFGNGVASSNIDELQICENNFQTNLDIDVTDWENSAITDNVFDNDKNIQMIVSGDFDNNIISDNIIGSVSGTMIDIDHNEANTLAIIGNVGRSGVNINIENNNQNLHHLVIQGNCQRGGNINLTGVKASNGITGKIIGNECGSVSVDQPYQDMDVFIANNGEKNSVPIYATDPTSPAEGDTWYNSTSNQFKGYNGVAVVILG